MVLIPMLAATSLLIAPVPPAASADVASAPACALTEADRTANRKLDYPAFDQRPTLPSNGRALALAGCFALAAEATEDYLAHGPIATPAQRANMAFHMAQYQAMAGDERGAARTLTLARRPDAGPDYPVDWNTFVDGMRAFLVRNRPDLEAAIKTVTARDTPGDRSNGRALQALSICFDRPYAEAWIDPACAPPVPPAVVAPVAAESAPIEPEPASAPEVEPEPAS